MGCVSGTEIYGGLSHLAFMRDIGAALTPDTPPDPDRMLEIYAAAR